MNRILHAPHKVSAVAGVYYLLDYAAGMSYDNLEFDGVEDRRVSLLRGGRSQKHHKDHGRMLVHE